MKLNDRMKEAMKDIGAIGKLLRTLGRASGKETLPISRATVGTLGRLLCERVDAAKQVLSEDDEADWAAHYLFCGPECTDPICQSLAAEERARPEGTQ